MEISELVIYVVLFAIGLYVPITLFKWQKKKSAYQMAPPENLVPVNNMPQPHFAPGFNRNHLPVRAPKHQSVNPKSFNDSWMLPPFKGHTAAVTSIDFATNGKYLATCAEVEAAQRQQHLRGAGPQDYKSRSMVNHEEEDAVEPSNSSSCSDDSHKSKFNKNNQANGGRSTTRRQRKKKTRSVRNNQSDEIKQNCDRKYSSSSSSSSSSPLQQKRAMPMSVVNREVALTPPLRMYTKLNMPDHELVSYLEDYVHDEDMLPRLGYPVELKGTGLAAFERINFSNFGVTQYNNAPNMRDIFINRGVVINDMANLVEKDGKEKERDGTVLSGDSGQGSAASSPPFMDGDVYDEDRLSDVKSSNESIPQMVDCIDRQCCRCKKGFKQTVDGEYVKKVDDCLYHPGKPDWSNEYGGGIWSCCKTPHNSSGCEQSKQHVWSGIMNGYNGPFEDYVITQPTSAPEDDDYGVYALDCEMCYTARGLELAKVTLVTIDGRRAYEQYVRPQNPVVDYNTQFSGITKKHLNNKTVKTLGEVQKDLLKIINDQTIIIGHALENDFRALRIIHRCVIDTSVVFQHKKGLPYRSSLKDLVSKHLGRSIQNDKSGHDSFEDARACLELLMWRVRRDSQRSSN